MPDSNAARIHAAETSGRRPLGRRIRVPAGAIVQTFPLASGTPTSGRTAITAAAQRLNPNTNGRKVDRSVKRPANEEWQGEAWALRDEVGELRFIGDRQARACSQVRIFIGKKEDPLAEPKPLEDQAGPAVDLNQQLFGIQAEVEQVLKRAAQHIIFNGESILLASEDDTGKLGWKAHSISEVTGSAGRWKLNEGLTARDIDDDTEVLVRAWNPHPEVGVRADAPVRAILPVARELIALTKYVSAQVDSRLAGSGLLLLPQGIESAFSKPAPELDDDGNPIDEDDDQTFADELADYMIVPVQDRAAGGSVVPFMATVPPELVDKIKHISFATPLDEHAPPLREEAIRRVGLGMDSDPSVLLGQTSGNHWSSWLVDDNETKFGVVPTVSTICHALTVGLVQPLLTAADVADAHLYQVWYDETTLQVRPDRSKDAQALFDKGVVSRDVLRRENGFSEDDKPDELEVKDKLLRELLTSRPDWADKILTEMGIIIAGVNDPATLAQATPAPAENAGDAPPPAAPPLDDGTGVAAEAPDGPPIPDDRSMA